MSQELEQAKKIATLEESVKSAHRRISDFTAIATSVHELAKTSAAMAVEVGHLAKKVSGIDDKLDVVRQEPAGKWKSLITQVVGLLAAVFAGYVLARLTGNPFV